MRLFVAIEVPRAVRDALASCIAPLRERGGSLRWIPPDNWHLTLAFLGDTPTGRRLRAQIALQAATRGAGPLELTIDGRLGRFGDRVLWAAVECRSDGLSALASGVRDALRTAGLAVEDRPFRAHLTIARARRGQRIPRPPAAVDGAALPASWTASTVALVSSRPTSAGSRYRPVATWPLGVSGGPSAPP